MKISDRFSDVVEELISVISLERGPAIRLIADSSAPKLAAFRDLDVSDWVMSPEEREQWFLFGDSDCTPAVIWPVNASFAGRRDDGWVFTNMRTRSPRDVRGKVRLIVPKMLQYSVFHVYRDGRTVAGNEFYAFVGGRWVDACHGSITRHHNVVHFQLPPDRDHDNLKGRMAIGLALRHRYEWSVSIGEPGGPSFRFSTDVGGVRAILSEREKGTNGRRDALRRWVTDHWRQSRSDPEEEFYVRKHLRGGEKFVWRGYECEWRPSQFDRDKNEELKSERSLMGRQAVRNRFLMDGQYE